MPKKLEKSEGDPNEPLPLQFFVPRWFKNDCIAEAEARGVGLTEWAKGWLELGLGKNPLAALPALLDAIRQIARLAAAGEPAARGAVEAILQAVDLPARKKKTQRQSSRKARTATSGRPG